MRYWWVNQNQTYKHEVPGGFLWSPKRNKNGGRNQFYDNMTEVRAGDLIFSFCDTRIKAVGVAADGAVSSDKPDFGTVGDQWHDEGWFVPVEFDEVENAVRPKDFIDELRPHFAPKYNPLQATGDGNQGVYFAEISEGFATTLLTKMGRSIDDLVAEEEVAAEREAEVAQQALEGRTDIGVTQKQQMVLARRGQGIFKANVRLNEAACRVTGVNDLRLLIASQIKPWSKSSDKEKLDGCNGLLLSPHVDRLFDRGLISFEDNGELIRSPRLDPEIWDAWGLGDVHNVGAFSDKQRTYLAYHRTDVFKSS
jgi:putative restriction endonuclease